MRYRARKTLRIGPFFQRFAASANTKTGKAKAGPTSNGVTFKFPLVGRVTYNFTRRQWTWDNPGPGYVQSDPKPRKRNTR